MESAFHEGADSFNYQVSFPTGGKRLSKGLAEITKGQAKCQHANAPPRLVPGRILIVPRIAPWHPSQHWCQCRHHQGGLTGVVSECLSMTAYQDQFRRHSIPCVESGCSSVAAHPPLEKALSGRSVALGRG